MSHLALAVLLLAITGHSSANWCVCKDGVSDQALQRTIDYACGAGADCNPLHQNAPCWNPNTVKAHCSYAVNSYFQRKGQAQGACDFAGTAQVSPSDPSTGGCVYPSSASAAGTSTTPVTSPTTGTPTTGTPSTGTPSMGTPSTGTPSMGTPSTGTPTTGTPSTGTPTTGTPSTGTPTMGTPSTGTPTMGTPSTGTPTMGTPSTGTPTMGTPSTTPYSGTPSTGVLGGIGNGIAPSGTGMNTDDNNYGSRSVNARPLSHLSCLVFTGLIMMFRLA